MAFGGLEGLCNMQRATRPFFQKGAVSWAATGVLRLCLFYGSCCGVSPYKKDQGCCIFLRGVSADCADGRR
jgi:hypothetical protein